MRGEVLHVFAFDLGAEVNLDRVGALLNELPTFEPLDIRRTAPKYVDLPRPLTARFPAVTVSTNQGDVPFELRVRIYSFGALSLTMRTPVEATDFTDLRRWGSLRYVDDAESQPLETWARRFFDEVAAGLEPALRDRYSAPTGPEPYVVYALTDAGKPVPELLEKDRQALAGLLANDPEPHRLSPEEVEENLRHWLRYYEDDLAIIDWEFGLLVEPSGRYEDSLYVIELANIQLLELRAYDQYLDRVLNEAYGDLDRFYGRGFFSSARNIQRDLSEARIDLTRLTDDVDNIGKIYGDYYLGKLHTLLKHRYHLAEWHRIVQEKMTTLNELYTLASHEVEHRQAFILEAAIVLLFIIDLVLLFVLSK